MRPDPRFLKQPKSFWAAVRTVSERLGYTTRGGGRGKPKAPSVSEIARAFGALNLDPADIEAGRAATPLGQTLADYFEYRAATLQHHIEPRLMNAEQAEALFEKTRKRVGPKCPLPMNKQKGEKKKHAFLTCLVNMMIEHHGKDLPVVFDPRQLTTVTRQGKPVRTLARRVDGACPHPVNPLAVWEIKEYYYTTTFGSRVADGVYETLLDGMELEEAREHEGIDVKHYLMVDAHFTWWECGKSYLCRIVDMLHMGYVDEVLFGREVVEEMPRIVGEWIEAHTLRAAGSS